MYKAAPAVTAAVSAGEADELGLAHETRAFLRSGGKRHEVRSSPLVIGRSRECDIPLDDPNVSRRHAELRPEEGTYWIVDLDSTNGIEVNGKTELVFEHAA
jgi:pSer/pThr/pTyr-binding forkhead associated (FHA) protein